MPTNDNDPAVQALPDAHGHAALLLIESLIHGLCENATLSVHAALDIVERAVDVQFDQAEAADDAEGPMWRSHALLLNIAASLGTDAKGGPSSPRLVR